VRIGEFCSLPSKVNLVLWRILFEFLVVVKDFGWNPFILIRLIGKCVIFSFHGISLVYVRKWQGNDSYESQGELVFSFPKLPGDEDDALLSLSLFIENGNKWGWNYPANGNLDTGRGSRGRGDGSKCKIMKFHRDDEKQPSLVYLVSWLTSK